ncbi:flavin reductase family protein [Clostridium sp.]|uniref:flavin reductase family protein n=1 Tax=Clostridium sp. TaxID=1506 RepID=UPI002A91F8DF|nr:flavin reductase [Clostridium sp.]MDY6012807.1 flavin reductase [Clostridium sp.]
MSKFAIDTTEALENLCLGGAFLTAGDLNDANTMTISWGSIGYMWRKPVFMALVRESRYTNEFLESKDTFTVSIPYDNNLKEALKICGTKSGRDINKEEVACIKFVKSKNVEAPVVEGCNKYYECKILYKNKMDLNNFDKDLLDTFYNDKNVEHVLYFGEIVEEY